MLKRAMLAALVAATTAVALLISGTAAFAATAPGYEEFSDCPDRSVASGISGCQVTVIDGGHITLGSKRTPIVDPIKLVVGANVGTGQTYPGSFDGGRQPIPGGLVGISGLDWLIYLFPHSLLGIYAETELAGPVGNLFAPTLALPIKVRLDSPLLNNNCYIGSNSNPISLNLTTGTTSPPAPNQPISGNPGSVTPDPSLPNVFRNSGLVYVDNAFAVPAADGCDLLGFGVLDALVNLQAGLPAAAGRNEAVQEADASLGIITAIYPPAGIEQ